MQQKALLFGNERRAEQIMKSTDPNKMKRYGRMLENFNERVWTSRAPLYIMAASLAKFGQNDDFRRRLVETGGAHIVDASPYDLLWGAGLLPVCDEIKNDPCTWPGRNLLGELLMSVRDYYRVKAGLPHIPTPTRNQCVKNEMEKTLVEALYHIADPCGCEDGQSGPCWCSVQTLHFD